MALLKASTAWSKSRRGAARNRSPSALYGSGYVASSWVAARNCAAAFQRLPRAWCTAPSVYCATTKLASTSIARESRSTAFSLASWPPRAAAICARANSSNARTDFVGVDAQAPRGLEHGGLAPRLRLAEGAQPRPVDLDEGGRLHETQRHGLGGALADPLLVGGQAIGLEGHDEDRPRLDRGLGGNHRDEPAARQDRDEHPASSHQAPSSPRSGTGVARRSLRLNQPLIRDRPPGPTRRRAISGTIMSATIPTSHGQISTAIRERRRSFKNASCGSWSAEPPVSSASSRNSVSSTPRSRRS